MTKINYLTAFKANRTESAHRQYMTPEGSNNLISMGVLIQSHAEDPLLTTFLLKGSPDEKLITRCSAAGTPRYQLDTALLIYRYIGLVGMQIFY